MLTTGSFVLIMLCGMGLDMLHDIPKLELRDLKWHNCCVTARFEVFCRGERFLGVGWDILNVFHEGNFVDRKVVVDCLGLVDGSF